MPLSLAKPKDNLLPAPMRVLAPYLILTLVVFTAYGNIFDNAFLFDDDLLIQINSYLRGWDHLGDILTGSTTSGAHIQGGFYRPVQILLYVLIFHLGNGGTFGFHILNLLLHIANTLFIFRLGIKLGFQAWGVFLAALIWGLHPLHTEAVTYMSATADPLFVFFSLGALIKLLPDLSPRKIFAIFPLFLLGLLTKETMVMFPLLVMSCLYLVSSERLNPRTYLRTWPLWMASLGYAYWRAHAPGLDGPQTYDHFYDLAQFSSLKEYADHPLSRFFTFFATLPCYLQLLVGPEGLHMERGFAIFSTPWHGLVLTGMGLCLLAAGHIVRSSRPPNKGLPLSWGLLWFASAHAPDTGLLIPMNSLFLEHWMYLPSAGLFLGIAETLVRLVQNRLRVLPVGASLAALAFASILSVKTYEQNKLWHDPLVFYTNIFAYGGTSARAYNNLALYYSDKGQYTEAIKAFENAIQISDAYAETRYNLALTYLGLPNARAYTDQIVTHLQRAIQINPQFFRAYQTLGDVYGILLNDKANADLYHARAAELLKQQP